MYEMKFFNKKAEAVEPKEIIMYTEDQLMARLKFFIGICLALTLVGIVFVVLYSLIFVTQPMNAISPMDQKFFELIIPIATFLTGTLSGIMLAGGDKDLQAKALEAANRAPAVSPAPTMGGGFGAAPSFGAPRPAPSFGAAPAAPSFGGAPSFGAPAAPMAPAVPMMSSTGKPMPVQDPEPEL
jgi:hypothetical protein